MSTLMVLMTKRGFPPDIRVEKEIEALSSHEYQVYLLSGSPRQLPEFQVVKGINVHRIRLSWSSPLLLSILVNHISLLFHLIREIAKTRIPIIHVHDLSYALLVTIVGRMFRKKIIYDAHENYAGMIRGYLQKKGLLRRIYFTAFLWYYILLEKIVCRLATKIIVVVNENKIRLVKLKTPEDKIVIVSNTPEVDKLRKLSVPYATKGKEIKISYVGGISYLRGLNTLVKALPLVIKRNLRTRLLLVGSGEESTMGELLKMSKQLGVEKYVTFTRWVPFNEAMKYVQESDIGVIPHLTSPQTNCTVPHKLFQYMFYGKPVIVSNVRPLMRIVTETQCGLVFRAGDYEELADRLLEVINDAFKSKVLGENGRKAVETKYNWKVDQKSLISIYEELSSK